ncbi:MAG: nucleoside 2-deoxyribosyltransferase [Thomasclavelia spiroformis]
MKEKIIINIFAAFQFKSDYTTRIELEGAIDEAILRIEEQCENIKINYSTLKLKSNEFINTQIMDKINQSDICIVNLTENNNNVLFELGYACGKEKKCILLHHENAEINKIPSDLSGLYVLKYSNERLSIRLSSELINLVNSTFACKKKGLI